MQSKQYAQLIPEYNTYGIKKSGCYILNQDIIDHYHSPVAIAVPLKHIDYQVEICNSIAKVVLQQVYTNPTEKYLELQYSIPIDPNVCIYKFNATFGDTIIQGVVKQKEQASKQYNKAIQQGKKAALGFINEKSEDIMNLKIGNLPPKENIKLRIQYLHELNVTQNMFWKIILQSNVWPRYINDKWRQQAAVSKEKKLLTQSPQYTWSFKVTLITSQRIVMAESTTHQMTKIQENSNMSEMTFVMEKEQKPYKDFTFIYSTDTLHKPTSILSNTDTSQTLLVSFIPQFNNLGISDAEKMEREGKDYQVSMTHCKGQFVFLLDRSGSMRNQRINKAKSALIFFIKSLPIDSFFNIISFGSQYEPMYKESVKTTTQTTQKTIQIINSYNADMGGTQIQAPLSYALNQKQTRNYPKHIFLLTDGDVSNTKLILNLIKRQSKFSTVHGIGIGNSCSRALIQGCSQQSRGRSIYISDNQQPSQKIICLLDQVLTPAITNFKLYFNEQIVQSVIPNPKQLPYILKNDPVSLYFFLKPDYQGNFQLAIQYTNPISQNVQQQNLNVIIPSQPNIQFLDKKAQHKKLKLLSQSLSSNFVYSQIMMAKPQNLKQYIIKQSIKHQVLCTQTAFICVQKNHSDSKRQQVIGTGTLKVQIPQMIKEIDNSKDNRLATLDQRRQRLAQMRKPRRCVTTSYKPGNNQEQQIRNNPIQSISHMDRLRQNLKMRYKAVNIFEDNYQQEQGINVKNNQSNNVQFKATQKSSILQQLKSKLVFKHKKIIRSESSEQDNIFNSPLELYQIKQIKMDSTTPPKSKQQVNDHELINIKPKRKLFDESESDDQIFKPTKSMGNKTNNNTNNTNNTNNSNNINSNIKGGQRLVQIQSSNGNWNSSNTQQILILLSLSNEKLTNVIKKYNDEDLIITLLIVKFLENLKQIKYRLVIKKAKQWIQTRTKQLSLTQQDINNIQNILQ